MHLYESNIRRKRIYVVGSSGVIGHSINRKLFEAGFQLIDYRRISWSDINYTTSQQIINFIVDKINAKTDESYSYTIVWAAGAAGFSSPVDVTEKELHTFNESIKKINKLSSMKFVKSKLRIVFISSIGGLFEGESYVELNTTPNPLRPYGELKLRQENYLLNQESLDVSIIRLPTVYSYINIKKRMGLVQTLVHNGLLRRTTHIFGLSTTLRDYVWADDVADFIIRVSEHKFNTKIFHLFSGKPTSILEIQKLLERTLRRQVILTFQHQVTNSLNICGKYKAYSGIWRPSSLSENVQRLINDYYLKNN